MPTLTLVSSHDFSTGLLPDGTPIPNGVNAITFSQTFYATATFASSQFNGVLFLPAIHVTGNAEMQTIVINGGSVDLAQWSFTNWNASDRIFIYRSSGSDSITGSLQIDTIFGGDGADPLNGGAGNDVFILTPLQSDRDIFPDFNFNLDRFQVSNAAFGGGLDLDSNGVLDANRFVANATGTATSADQRFIYDTTQRLLIYDSNGSVSGGVQVIGVVTSSGISAASFNVVA